MAGQNIARLQTSVNGMNEDDVEVARAEWARGQGVLGEVSQALEQSGKDIKNAFGGKSEIGIAAQAVLDEVRGHLDKRSGRMGEAQEALSEVGSAITRAKATATTMPDSAPGDAPRMEGGPYVDDAAEIQAMKQFAAKNRQYTQQVNAYNDADERARVRVEDVNDVFQRAGDIFSTMWEPDVQPPETGGRETGTAGGGRPTRGAGVNPHVIGGSDDGGTGGGDGGGADGGGNGGGGNGGGGNGGGGNGGGGNGGGGNGGGGNGGGDNGGGDNGGGWGDGGSHGSGSGSDGISIDPQLGGVAGGAFGAAGLRGLLGGTSSPSAAVPGQSGARPIGSSSRSGTGGVLGRNGAQSPGQTTGRPGTGAGGGRGTGGRRGGPGTGSGRRGRRKDDERDGQVDHLEIEDEWTDDEGQYPGVIQ